jgi:multiple sugar transport system substrate-binding protein
MGSLAAPWRRSGLVTLATLAIIVSACSGSATPAPAASAPAASAAAASPGGLPAASGTTTLGSNESDANPKAAVAAIADYCSKQAGITITINTTDHNTFQNQISSYLQGKPDDVVKWFAGNRLRFFASQGLLTPIDDVWAQIGANYTDAFKTAATGADGHQYLVPSINYPWVVMYRKSLWTKMGYAVPATITDFVTLAKKMQTDGLVPLAYGDKDGWPAMGTFDILNMRMNGYDFHVGLMAGTEKWTDPKVKAVFQEWASLLPYFQQGAPGRTWQDAATAALVPDASGKYVAGMYFLGTFANAQVPAADQNDIGMFTFPTLGTAYDSENAMDAPIDGFMLSAHPANVAAAKAFLACIGTPGAQKAYTAVSGDIAAVKNADASGYTPFQVDEAKIIAGAGKIAQFLDRDARSDFAGPSGMQGFLLNFLNNPSQDLDKFLSGIQAYYDSLPPQ